MPKIDIEAIPPDTNIGYPEPFRRAVIGRARKRLGHAAGLTQFGVNLARLEPGAASSQRHWHEAEDELIFILEGELVLCEDAGETVLRAGDAAAWRAGAAVGHCVVNRSDHAALFLEIGARAPQERVHYPDLDLKMERDETGPRYLHGSGEPY